MTRLDDTTVVTDDETTVDVDAYLDRIGYGGPRSPDRATLEAIVAHHTATIPFENLDPFLGHPPELDVDRLQAKLVHGGRGGYCFEQNLLLKHALGGLGFTTTGLAARVVWNRAEDLPLPPLGHMLVRVDLPDGPHLVDVGFGGQTPTGVLLLATAVEQPTPHGPYRLVERDGRPARRDVVTDDHSVPDDTTDFLPVPADAVLVLQSRVRDEWRALYQIEPQAKEPSDYEVSNWYVATHPDSVFVNHLTVARAGVGERYALNDNQLTIHRLDRESDQRVLESPPALFVELETTFGIDLASVDRSALAGKLAHLW